MLREVPSIELAEWMAYYTLEPWGEDRADLRSAIVASLIHNTNAKRSRPVRDFMAYQEPRPPQTPDEMREAMKLYAARFA